MQNKHAAQKAVVFSLSSKNQHAGKRGKPGSSYRTQRKHNVNLHRRNINKLHPRRLTSAQSMQDPQLETPIETRGSQEDEPRRNKVKRKNKNGHKPRHELDYGRVISTTTPKIYYHATRKKKQTGESKNCICPYCSIKLVSHKNQSRTRKNAQEQGKGPPAGGSESQEHRRGEATDVGTSREIKRWCAIPKRPERCREQHDRYRDSVGFVGRCV